MVRSKGSINIHIENYVKELKGKNRSSEKRKHKNAFLKAYADATGTKLKSKFGFSKNPKLLQSFNTRLEAEKENECMIEKEEDCTKNLNRCYWNPITKINPSTGKLLKNGNIGCKKTTLSDNLPMAPLRYFKGDAIYTPNQLRDPNIKTDHLRLKQEEQQYLMDEAAEKGIIAMKYAKKYDEERAERKRAEEYWKQSELEGGRRRKTRRKSNRRRRKSNRRRRKSKRKTRSKKQKSNRKTRRKRR